MSKPRKKQGNPDFRHRVSCPLWASVAQEFGCVWMADGATLEALKKHLGQLQQKTGAVLGGKMLMIVEAFSHRPVAAFFDQSTPNVTKPNGGKK